MDLKENGWTLAHIPKSSRGLCQNITTVGSKKSFESALDYRNEELNRENTFSVYKISQMKMTLTEQNNFSMN